MFLIENLNWIEYPIYNSYPVYDNTVTNAFMNTHTPPPPLPESNHQHLRMLVGPSAGEEGKKGGSYKGFRIKVFAQVVVKVFGREFVKVFVRIIYNLEKSDSFEVYLGIVGVFCIIHCYFECVYRIRCHFLCIWRYLKNIFFRFLKKYPRSVNYVRTNSFCWYVSWFVGIVAVLNGPPTHPNRHPQRQCQSSLPGEKIWKTNVY